MLLNGDFQDRLIKKIVVDEVDIDISPMNVFVENISQGFVHNFLPNDKDIIFIFLLKGKCDVNLKSVTVSLLKGDVVVLNESKPYSITYKSDTVIARIFFKKDLFKIDALSLGYLIPNDEIIFFPGSVKLEEFGGLKYQILSLVECDFNNIPAILLGSYRRFFVFFLLESVDHNLSNFVSLKPTRNFQIERLRQWVLENPKEEYKASDLAGYLKISEKSLYNIFRKEFGMSSRVYVNNIKFECVYFELSSVDFRGNITQIILDYGFSNPGRFSKEFKEYFGISPSHLLKSSKC